jgi:hypothetical protein
MPQQEVSSDELLKTAMDVIDRFGITEYLGTEETITEEIDGVERKVIGAGIALSDDSGSVWAFRTLEGDYLKVESVSRNVDDPHMLFGEVTESVTVLEVRQGETTEFNSKQARYSLRELTALSQGETTQSRKEGDIRIEKSRELWDRLGNIFTKEQSLQTITSEEANPILDHMDDVLNEISDLAELDERSIFASLPSELLQEANSDLAAVAERPGFNQLAPDILHHFDALQNRSNSLQDQVESTEKKWELAESYARNELSNPSEVEAIAPKLSPHELKESAARYVEKLKISSVLEVQADNLMKASEFHQDMAVEICETAFDKGANEDEWREAVDAESTEWDIQAARDVVIASGSLLKTHESDNFDLHGTQISYDRENQQLTVVDEVTGSTMAAQWNGESWEQISSTFNPAQMMGLKEELEGQLDLDSFQLPAALDELAQKKVAGAQLSQ